MTTQTPDAVRESLQKIERAYREWDPDATFASTALAVVSKIAADALAALDSRAGDAGEGWKLVPVAPTPEMVEAALDSVNPIGCCLMDDIDAAVAYRAMIAATPAPAVDAVPAGEVRKMVETLRGEMAAAPKRDWYPVHRDYLDTILSAALSHGEGR